MFYSHEVLTSRKYGMATVWLLATLGPKPSLKKVSKKAILDVDVTRSCNMIAEPAAPMALRLQSSLLYGVTRVFSQQCGYVLVDVENARNDMRALVKALRTAAITTADTTRARADQLVLDDDPDFLPEIDMVLADLSIPDEMDLQQDSIATTLLPSTMQSSVDASLDIPSLHTPSAPRSTSIVPRRTTDASPHPRHGLEEDLGLDLQDDLADMPDLAHDEMDVHLLRDESRARSGAPSRAQSIVQESLQSGVQHNILGEDEASDLPQLTTSSSTASAPLHRRVHKTLQLDAATQLRASEMKKWSLEYLDMMEEQRKHKLGPLSRALAKENANHLFFGIVDQDHPLAMYYLLPAQPHKRPSEDIESERPNKRQASEQPVDTYMPSYDEIETGRAEPTPLPERHSTLLPWSSTGQSGTRISRASHVPQSLSPPPLYHGFATSDADFEAYGPAGQVDTQTAAESQWLHSVFEDESMNFLRFVDQAIKRDANSSIGFSELLPPEKHTNIVAAQAFMHVLALVTRGLMATTQVEVKDDIGLQIV